MSRYAIGEKYWFKNTYAGPNRQSCGILINIYPDRGLYVLFNERYGNITVTRQNLDDHNKHLPKYRCDKDKEDILSIIVEHFENIHKDLNAEHSDENHGRYSAMIDLLAKLEIYENTEEE